MSAPPAQTRTLRVRTLVQPGGRVEVVSPQLKEGEVVEIEIRSAPSQAELDEGRRRVLEMIRSSPPSTRTLEEWEEYEREFQAERDSWD